jgi:hypothetical protein
MDLTTRVAALSDLVVVDVCQRLAADLLRRPGPSLEEAAAALPPAFTDDADFRRMLADLDESYHTKLPPGLSVRLAREILANAAIDPALAATLAAVLDAYRDTRQICSRGVSTRRRILDGDPLRDGYIRGWQSS